MAVERDASDPQCGLRRHPVTRVACEASGRYHRALHRSLQAAGIKTVAVNLRSARCCAEALGELAETAGVDAAVLAPWRSSSPRPRNPGSSGCFRTWRTPSGCWWSTGTRAASTSPKPGESCIRGQFQQSLQRWEHDLENFAREGSEALARQNAVLASIPGAGPVHIATLLATMPELGRLDRHAAGRLLGVTPCAQDSSVRQVPRRALQPAPAGLPPAPAHGRQGPQGRLSRRRAHAGDPRQHAAPAEPPLATAAAVPTAPAPQPAG